VEQPPSCGLGVQTEIQGLVATPLCTPPWGSQGVVLPSSKVWNGRHGEENLAIGIACFTNPPPLTGDQTHTHTVDMSFAFANAIVVAVALSSSIPVPIAVFLPSLYVAPTR
jgi:hypothetical protein